MKMITVKLWILVLTVVRKHVVRGAQKHIKIVVCIKKHIYLQFDKIILGEQVKANT